MNENESMGVQWHRKFKYVTCSIFRECKEEIAKQVKTAWNTQPAFNNSVKRSLAGLTHMINEGY